MLTQKPLKTTSILSTIVGNTSVFGILKNQQDPGVIRDANNILDILLLLAFRFLDGIISCVFISRNFK